MEPKRSTLHGIIRKTKSSLKLQFDGVLLLHKIFERILTIVVHYVSTAIKRSSSVDKLTYLILQTIKNVNSTYSVSEKHMS